MNILLINYEYPPIGGGAANAACHIAKELSAKGNKVTVLTSLYQKGAPSGVRYEKGFTDEDGVEVFRCVVKRSQPAQASMFEMFTYVLSAGLSLGRVIRERKIEGSIVFFTLPCGPLGLISRYLYKVPYIISLRGGDVPGIVPQISRLHLLLTPLRRLILRDARHVVANSDGLRAVAEKADPFLSVKVIPNGVDAGFFFPGKKPVGEKPFEFLFVGRFQPQKNIHFFLEQFAEVFRKYENEAVLNIVGDGPLKAKLESYSMKLGLEKIVIWHTWLDKEKLRAIYQQADCLVNPSLYEGMPNVVLEGMACGLPVIASDVIGNNAVVKNGETGFLFSLGQADELRRHMIFYVEHREKAREMGLSGRREVEKMFTWSAAADGYLKLLRSRD